MSEGITPDQLRRQRLSQHPKTSRKREERARARQRREQQAQEKRPGWLSGLVRLRFTVPSWARSRYPKLPEELPLFWARRAAEKHGDIVCTQEGRLHLVRDAHSGRVLARGRSRRAALREAALRTSAGEPRARLQKELAPTPERS